MSLTACFRTVIASLVLLSSVLLMAEDASLRGVHNAVDKLKQANPEQKDWKSVKIYQHGSDVGLCLNGLRKVSDISALKGLKLNELDLTYTNVSDVAPLRDMPLVSLQLRNTPAVNLSPLAGMKLEHLDLAGTDVADITVVKGMPLKTLDLRRTHLTDNMIPYPPRSDFSFLKDMTTLEKISDLPPDEFWKDYHNNNLIGGAFLLLFSGLLLAAFISAWLKIRNTIKIHPDSKPAADQSGSEGLV